ncbi:N-formylglutamate amidohydrolase [Acetobacter sp. AN02]|uniref:N-formylglutamate amidohydrolase n=1 Tax=Acetobacter sp. AN02 TaxID=2894186 RepID=UPI002434280B|nr:N-formylglutamate amidohydrolase [Acetobacter sp. AN02]MDG6093747.1 N-formylglutamate amidohydrolase [Acetobacter sp. AN02]
MPLLMSDDPNPVHIFGRDRGSPFLLVSDHAGRAIPEALADLGVSAAERSRHIGWDIGIDGTGRRLADRLGTLLIEQSYSRLVIDCNRAPGNPTSVVEVSDGTVIPANRSITPEARAAREDEIHAPYHDRIREELDRRLAAGRETFLVALHSFTPVMGGHRRPWLAGVLHNYDPRFGRIVLNLLSEKGILTGDNEPYALTGATDYTIPTHGEQREIPHLELEIRQDLIESEAGQEKWSALLEDVLLRSRDIYIERYESP